MPAASDIPAPRDDHRQARVHGLRGLLRGLVAGDAARFFCVPIQGRMERRGGEPSLFDVEVKADGQTGKEGEATSHRAARRRRAVHDQGDGELRLLSLRG